MSDLKNKDLGIFQVFSYTLFIFLSGIICSFTSTGQTTVTFSTVGAVDWTVPDDVYSITIHCWGGGGAGGGVAIGANITQGAAGGGGKGGMYSVTSLSVTPGQVLRVNVGAGGTGTTSAGNAGGPSWVSTTGSTPWPTATNGAWLQADLVDLELQPMLELEPQDTVRQEQDQVQSRMEEMEP